MDYWTLTLNLITIMQSVTVMLPLMGFCTQLSSPSLSLLSKLVLVSQSLAVSGGVSQSLASVCVLESPGLGPQALDPRP